MIKKRQGVILRVIIFIYLLTLVLTGCTNNASQVLITDKNEQIEKVVIDESEKADYETKALMECETKDEALKTISTLRMFMRWKDVLSIVGTEDEVYTDGFMVYRYFVNDELTVDLKFGTVGVDEYRLYGAFLETGNTKEQIVLQYGGLENYHEQQIDDVTEDMFEGYRCTSLLEDSYYIVQCQNEVHKDVVFWKVLYKDENQDYYDLDYIEPTEENFRIYKLFIYKGETVYIDIFVHNGQYIMLLSASDAVGDISLIDNYGQWQSIREDGYAAYMRVLDSLEDDYEVTVGNGRSSEFVFDKEEISKIVSYAENQ